MLSCRALPVGLREDLPLRSLAGGPVQRIKAAHLLGGAVGTGSKRDWDEAPSAAYGGVHNYYSKRDDVLRILYSAGRLLIGTPAIGRNPIRANAPNIVNHNVTDDVGNPGEFKEALAGYLAN